MQLGLHRRTLIRYSRSPLFSSFPPSFVLPLTFLMRHGLAHKLKQQRAMWRLEHCIAFAPLCQAHCFSLLLLYFAYEFAGEQGQHVCRWGM